MLTCSRGGWAMQLLEKGFGKDGVDFAQALANKTHV